MQWTPEVKLYVKDILDAIKKSDGKLYDDQIFKNVHLSMPIWMVQTQDKENNVRIMSDEAKFRYLWGISRSMPTDLKQVIGSQTEITFWRNIEAQYHTVFISPDYSYSKALTLNHENKLVYCCTLPFCLARIPQDDEQLIITDVTMGKQVVQKVTLDYLERMIS